jgi:hypothetical protein
LVSPWFSSPQEDAKEFLNSGFTTGIESHEAQAILRGKDANLNNKKAFHIVGSYTTGMSRFFLKQTTIMKVCTQRNKNVLCTKNAQRHRQL